MQKRLIPISPDIHIDIHHWLDLYRSVLNDYSASNKKVILEIISSALYGFCNDKSLFLLHHTVKLLPHDAYPTFKSFWLYMYSLRNLMSAAISNHATLPNYFKFTSTATQRDIIKGYIQRYHHQGRRLARYFQSAFVCTDRVAYHYSQHILYRKEV